MHRRTHGLATKHKGLFKKAGSATIVDLNMLGDIIAGLPDADINVSDHALEAQHLIGTAVATQSR